MAKKVLLLPMGVGLAHVGRLIMVARELKLLGVDVMFGAGSDAVDILKRETLPFLPVAELEHKFAVDKVKKNNFIVYTPQTLKSFVKAELALYKTVNPDLVVFDTRPTVRISAQIACIPSVSVTNADVSGYYDLSKTKFPAQTLVGKYLPKRLAELLDKNYNQKFLTRLGPHLMQAVMVLALMRFSPTLFNLGYKISTNPFQLLLGDLTLIADIPQYRPVKKLSKNVKMVGPIFWDAGETVPQEVERLHDKKDIIYVTASGTGDKETFFKILSYLSYTKYNIVATTGNTLLPSEVKKRFPDLIVTDFIPGSFIMKRAKLVIFPGGNSTCYQALAFGVPQIITPFHFDQEDNANQLIRLGTGVMINPWRRFSQKTLLSTVDKILSTPSYYKNAGKLKSILSHYDGKRKASEEIVKFLSK